jgi:hypothetical protein
VDRLQGMSRSPVRDRWWVIGVVGAGLSACGVATDVPHRSDGAAPVGSGVMLSGVGAPDADAAVGSGDDTLITDINDGSGSDASAVPGGIGSGGAPEESAGGIGGAASSEGGVAGAGGRGGAGHGGANGGAAGKSGATGAGGAANPPPTLYFSEYVEGSSSYKSLEITAQKRSILDGCKVGTYFNGKAEATVVATLSGVLEAGQVLTLCSSSLQAKLGAVLCKQVGNLTFNGDDAIAVSCDGKILDVIGQVGVDPGTGWGSAAKSTLDHTLRRKCSVTSGDAVGTNAFDPSVEWQVFALDTFNGLGARGC